MVKEFKLPDIGEGIHEGEIVRWLVKEGDAVSEDQPIAEVMTDKATVEITSPYTGTVQSLNAGEGETVLVGATIIVIDDGSGGGGAASADNGKQAAEKAAPEKALPEKALPEKEAPEKEAPEKAAPEERSEERRAPEPRPEPERVATHSAGPSRVSRGAAEEAPAAHPAAATSGPVLATPATRKLAREHGVDIRAIHGTGPRGRVTREDVERAQTSAPASSAAPASPTSKASKAEAPASRPGSAAAPRPMPPATTPTPTGSEERIPLRGLRKKIAEHMARSKRTAAHFTYVEEIDVTELVGLRREMKELASERGVKLTYLPFIMKAIVAGLRQVPTLNATLDEERSEIVIRHDYNFGIAVDTDAGLVVPVVKAVDRRSMLDIAREVERVATAARDQKIALDDLRGGTFTITNAGNIGGLFATPVINVPEVAIVGIHKIYRRPVVRDERIEIGDVMYLSISIDHRVVDGADGARFMNVVKRLLENPKLLLLEGV